MWQVLSHDEIAYHVKRLICESFAEIVPVEEDWRLLRRIFQHYPDLFRRLLWRVEGNTWFNILTQHWLSEAKVAQERENWLLEFIQCLKVWMNQYPVDVVKLWKEAIDSNWASKPNVAGEICSALTNFRVWNAEGVRELLEVLIKEASTNSDFGDVLSKWVQTTNSGDDLLWRYITRNVLPEDVCRWSLGDKLCCGLHTFHQENFLVERLGQSDDLLALVINDLEHWSAEGAAGLRDTSWILRHSQNSIHPVNDLIVLLDSLEKGLKHRARLNDAWWQKNEPKLRSTQEETIRCFVIQAYKENIQANIPGVENQLQDNGLLQCSDLSYELGELMLMGYPYISQLVCASNQKLILSLYPGQNNVKDDSLVRASYKVYNLLTWIPYNFRTLETQNFINIWQEDFCYSRPSPKIYSWSGLVAPPLSPQDLLKLSNDAFFRLLHYYQECRRRNSSDREFVGGFNEVRKVLGEACCLKPARFLDLFPHFIEEDLHQDYINTVVEGITNYLQYQFGNARPQHEWKPIAPLPEGEILAAALLKLLERYSVIWKDSRTVSRALEACCYVLDDPESADRLTLLLFWLWWDKDPSAERITNNEKELYSITINSTRGIAAVSAMTLCNRLLEKEQPLPELLPFLLRHFAQDSVICVRIAILQQLPFLIYKQPDLGWQLLADVFQEPQPHLWEYAEQCLYYHYRYHYDQVAPYLNRLLHEAMVEAGDIWGRISTLASLAGHISQEQLFDSLKTTNADAWKGAAQVFRANINYQEHTAVCNSAMVIILHHGNISAQVVKEVGKCFGEEADKKLIRIELALAFLNTLSVLAGTWGIHDFLEWLGYEARRNPLSALEVAEVLVEKLEEIEQHQIWHTEPLIVALNEILREADETDDPKLIQRAIYLQDSFLKLNVRGIEELLNRAAQN